MNAIITGATKGIGRSIAENLAKEGYNLLVNARNVEDLEKMKNDFAEKYPDISIITSVTDMSVKSEVTAFVNLANTTLNSIDVLVNNAGVFIPGSVQEEAAGSLEKMIETNLYSAYYLSKGLLSKMIAQQSGHIFNICSIASKIAYPNGGSYSISKFAMLGFSKVLREELKDKGIKVTAILPGATWSNSWDGVDLPESRLMQANDVSTALIAALKMSKSAVMEEIILRPQLGDL